MVNLSTALQNSTFFVAMLFVFVPNIGVNYKKFGVSEDIIDIGTGSSKFLKILTG